MISSSGEEITEAFEALYVARSRVSALSFDALTTPERLAYLEQLEQDAWPGTGARPRADQPARRAGRRQTLGGRLPAVLGAR